MIHALIWLPSVVFQPMRQKKSGDSSAIRWHVEGALGGTNLRPPLLLADQGGPSILERRRVELAQRERDHCRR